METVSSVASAASRAIWGDTTKGNTVQNEPVGQEPVSGELGDVKMGEPYDKGNDGQFAYRLRRPESRLTKPLN